MRVLRANVAPRPAAGERDCFLIHALCLSLKVPGGFPRLRKTLASTLALPPDLRQKVEKSFNGLKRGSATMHSRTCMVGLGNFHGSALRLPWLDFATSMVQLSEMHGSAFAHPFIVMKQPFQPPGTPRRECARSIAKAPRRRKPKFKKI